MLQDDQIAGLVLFPIALVGVLANWAVTILIRKLPSLNNSFGSLTASQAFGDATISTIFAFVISTMCFFDLEDLKSNSSIIGHILIIAYEISTYSHLCISLNRFCSIVAPVRYESIFSASNTTKLIIFSWTLTILPSFYLYVYNDCKYSWSPEFWLFAFSTTPVCLTISWYADFLKFNAIVILIAVIDVVTVSKVRSYKAKVFNGSSQSAKKTNFEMSFLKQACLQALVFTCELVTYFLITPRIDPNKKWIRFALSTVAWASVHTMDGIITLSFNKDFSQTIFRRVKIKESSTVNNCIDSVSPIPK
ncbi:G-protein coupled receptors family 1 profile domain-containing protein [Caenorhabditis elegans]|uniref:G-protein coupled receptors family 1 profile domain-containing protein n=1 Tax=Caenorhabditis elegans TaxID=6239 RepID=Q9XX72_CAEEL|nr:G-protein coupled receptors family 1 profile domain-containing protein [Caenorhabditis elegans]CAA20963.2 G-protein coupled receptors family 1 profile domain-containing protein [Caenorhabditis elegans]|eukprot:NP_507293.2 Serpentine Receptor, class X [Caenorhabditis elegans]